MISPADRPSVNKWFLLFSWEETWKFHLQKSLISMAIPPCHYGRTCETYTSILSLPESCGIIHTPLWVITTLLPSFHFLVTISITWLRPAKSFITVEDCCFPNFCIIILFPRAYVLYYHQLYQDEGVLVWPWRKLFLNCLLSEVVISCHSGPLLFLFLNQCYCSIIYIQYNAPNLSVHFCEFWQIYMPIQPPPQSR